MTNDPGVGAFAALLGVQWTTMADGRARFELEVRPGHLNPHGVIHGGVGALTSRLRPGDRCATRVGVLEARVFAGARLRVGRSPP